MEHRMKLRLVSFCLALTLMGTASPSPLVAQDEKTTWDGLHLEKSSRSQRVYLLPGADFRPYTKVMLDPTEVAFRKNWVRDYNRDTMELSRRIGQDDVDRVTKQASTGFGTIFAEEYQQGGFQVVQSPGPDVLRIRTGVIDLAVNAPDVKSASRTYSASWEAGEATLVIEARDSQTGALLGRALDRRLAGDSMPYLRNSVTNKADFKSLFRKWAKLSVDGLKRLQASSPVNLAQK
jgi:hypothetical protein